MALASYSRLRWSMSRYTLPVSTNRVADDTEGIGALLQIIGRLYSVVYAFATYVIRGQFAAVEHEILKESGALKDLILFSKGLKEAARDPVVRAVRGYTRSHGIRVGQVRSASSPRESLRLALSARRSSRYELAWFAISSR